MKEVVGDAIATLVAIGICSLISVVRKEHMLNVKLYRADDGKLLPIMFAGKRDRRVN